MITTDILMDEYIQSHPKSAQLHKQATGLFAADGATHIGRIMDPFRPYIVKAEGSYKWDVDGHQYIDYVMGHGSLLFGHSHPVFVKAVQDQIARGAHYGDNHALEVQWAGLIQKAMPAAERIEFFACGQESNIMAVRLARVFTGRKKILRFMENFHGWADELCIPSGLPGVVAEQVKIIPYDLDIVEKELATREYAIFLTEGGGAHMSGQIPWDLNFIRALPELAKKYGTVWHLDEVVTGFRDHPGGFQALVGVKPDLFSLGKIIGGGLAAGALAGRADIMNALHPDTSQDKRALHSGTWNANPVVASAGIATLEMCLDGKPQQKANELSVYLRQKANALFRQKGFEVYLYGRSISHVYIGPFDYEPKGDKEPPTKDIQKIEGGMREKTRLHLHTTQRGISTLSARMFIMSSVHTREDIDKTIAVLTDSLDAMLKEGTLKPTRK